MLINEFPVIVKSSTMKTFLSFTSPMTSKTSARSV